jgi:hypothetical protein
MIASVQLEPGQSGAFGIGFGVGGFVVTVNATVPFLIWDAGIDVEPVTVTGAGFCPGGWFFPDGLVQVAVGFAVALSKIERSSFPSPASAALALSVSPLSVKEGLLFGGFKCTLAAYAAVPNSRARAAAGIIRLPNKVDIASSLNARFWRLPGGRRSPRLPSRSSPQWLGSNHQ